MTKIFKALLFVIKWKKNVFEYFTFSYYGKNLSTILCIFMTKNVHVPRIAEQTFIRHSAKMFTFCPF